MTRFMFVVQMLSPVTKSFYEFDCECEAQCIKEAKAIVQTLANAIIDTNPDYQFIFSGSVLKPLLEVVPNVPNKRA